MINRPLLLVLCLCLPLFGIPATWGVEMTVKPARSAFVEGEPIQLIMRFQNKHKKLSRVDFGAAGREKVSIELTRKDGKTKGKTTVVNGKAPSGVSFRRLIEIAPGEEKSEHLFLDDFIKITGIGEFSVTVRIIGGESLKDTTMIHVIPTVKATCAKLWAKYTNGDSTSEERHASLKLICLTRHRDAAEYQQKILSQGLQVIGFQNMNNAVYSLISSREPDTMQFLVKDILEKHKKDSTLRRLTLYHLKSVIRLDAKKNATMQLLEPYKTEIGKAALIGIHD